MTDLDRNARKKLKTLDRESRERDTALGKDVSEVRDSVARTQNVVVDNLNAVKELRTELDQVHGGLAGMIEEMSGGLRSLAETMKSMERQHEQASHDLLSGLGTSQEASRVGLQQVSTSVAIADSLKSAAEAEEIEIEMAEAVRDLEARHLDTELALEEQRLAYDRAAQDVYDSLNREFESIGEHVVRLQELIGAALNATPESESRRGEHQSEVQSAYLEGAAGRDERVHQAVDQVNPDALENLADRRGVVDRFLHRFIGPDPTPVGALRSRPLGFPVIAVASSGTEYDGDRDGLDLYGPECGVFDCARPPAQSCVPDALKTRIARICEPLAAAGEDRAPLGEDVVDALKSEMSVLTAAGVLNSGDAALVMEHLDTHPLFWLES